MAHPVVAALRKSAQQQDATTILDRVENTFGPNPCQAFTLRDTQTGQPVITGACDRKRCVDCGPRKEMILWLGLETAFGTNTHIARLHQTQANQAIDAARQRRHRTGTPYHYAIIATGTPHEVFLISDTQLAPQQRFMDLTEWRTRIVHGYRYGRLRKSADLFTVTSCPRSRRPSRDTPSGLYYRTADTEQYAGVEGLTWADLLAELTYEHGDSLEAPPDDLPIPF